jgi:hypothetical protein
VADGLVNALLPAAIVAEIQRLMGENPLSRVLSYLRAFKTADKVSLNQLDPGIRDELDRLLRDGRFTIDQITSKLRELGAEVSRSAVGRLKKTYEERLSRYREAQEVAGVWLAKLGEDSKGDVGLLVAEMLKLLAFQSVSEMTEGEAEVAGPKDIAYLAKALKDLQASKALAASTELAVREKMAKLLEAEKRAQADAAVAAAKARGMNEDDAAFVRARILGIQMPTKAEQGDDA